MQHTEHPGFDGLGISPEFLEILKKNNFTIPTPIQLQAIKPAMEGKDVVGIAQTGTGKTLAFGLPLLQRLRGANGIGLIVLPTRELAIQVDEALGRIGGSLGLATAILIGGESMGKQIASLHRKPYIVIGTPGRLIDHIEKGNLKLGNVKIIVLDEADRMLDIGFEPQIKKMFNLLPSQRQVMLFSATMPSEIVKIAATYMTSPVRVEVAPAGTAAELVEQEIFLVKKEERLTLLAKILDENPGSILLFLRTKHGVRKLCLTLRNMGYGATEIHSNRSLGQRKEALAGFKSGGYRVLVATDIAARGIDVRDIERLIRKEIPVTSHGGQTFLADAPVVRSFGHNRHLRKSPPRWRRNYS